MENPATGASNGEIADSSAGDGDPLSFRCPTAEDGPAVTALIAACPPLDRNSAYCNLLQCSDFAETCVVAEQGGSIVGWISGYRPPERRHEFFVWQVAVSAAARGQGLGGHMLDELIARPASAGVTDLITTVTADNQPSRAMFAGFARRHGAELTEEPRFEEEAHFAGAHATEYQLRISPINSASRTTR
ncbi:diaminobutyrate acetyltransferase [Novosphingobium sp. ZN18A2]|uniref:diaminobutyrate acetyltransferase n=1 Tax=Novosphingobium sp. ZN18A2 TaxID=3079861 RepID=UPI0030CBC47B